MALVELGRYARNEAFMVIGRLDAEGIDSVAFDGHSSIADGSWLLVSVRVMIDEDDVATARRALAAA